MTTTGSNWRSRGRWSCVLKSATVRTHTRSSLAKCGPALPKSRDPTGSRSSASGDGEQAVLGTRIRVTYGNQVQIGTCINDIAKALGVGAGNLSYAVSQLQNRGLTTIYPRGVALSGNAWKELVTICKSCGLEATIQDGALLILEQGQALQNAAVRLAADSGLEGSPTADNDGTVNAVARLIPELRPGCKVQLETVARVGSISGGSSVSKGVFRIYDAEYTGDSHGEDWHVSLGMQKISNAVIQLQEVQV